MQFSTRFLEYLHTALDKAQLQPRAPIRMLKTLFEVIVMPFFSYRYANVTAINSFLQPLHFFLKIFHLFHQLITRKVNVVRSAMEILFGAVDSLIKRVVLEVSASRTDIRVTEGGWLMGIRIP